METAVHAVHNGAFDYISKPFVIDEMLRILHRIEEKFQLSLSKTVGSELAESLPKTEIIGATPKMIDIYKKVAKTARIEAPVLVIGESGSGKELIARALHENSARASAPFVVINCGALPETLLESELYGHERGSFTGATGSRKGLFESASGGTVFLDEISETSLNFQVKLLRVIQEREIRRVGSNDTIQVDVRLIAATNRDLREMVRTGRFREDLFHRLNVFTIALPALRDRKEDIPLLSSYFLKLFTEKTGKTVRLASDALEAMKHYCWPGNVRELDHVVERAVLMSPGGIVTALDLVLKPASDAGVSSRIDEMSLEEVERLLIKKALARFGGNANRAAEALGLSRSALYRRLQKYGLP